MRRTATTPGDGTRRARAAAFALLLALAASPLSAQPPPSTSLATAPEDASRIDAAACTLADATASDAERQRAAETLVALAALPAARDAVAQSLVEPLAGTGGGVYALRAIARCVGPSPRLYPLLERRLARAEANERPRLLASIASFRTRDAARLLIRSADDAQDEGDDSTRRAAFAALARIAARDDLVDDDAAWAAWLERADALSESQWRLILLDATARRADTLQSDRQRTVTRLAETFRKLHLATPADGRSALLAAMLDDDIPEVRDLGFELVGRELSVTGTLRGPVGDASLRLLTSADPLVRSSAAVLVRQLGPDGAGAAVAAALARETDPRAASDLLLAAVRWPEAALTAPAVSWLESGGPAASAAAEACWSLYRAGELGIEGIDRALAAIRAIPVDRLNPAACSLLAMEGLDADRARLAPLLTSDSPALRTAAAESLVWHPEYKGDILAAATQDPDLFDVATRAVLVGTPTAEGFRAVRALPQPSPDVWRAGLLRLARALPAPDLWSVAQEEPDPALRSALLGRLTMDERVMSERSDPAQLAAIAAGVVALASLQLERREAAAALSTLDAAPFASEAGDAAAVASLRAAALVGLGRLDLAAPLDAPAAAWVHGLDLARDAPYAAEVVEEIERRFGDALTADQRAVLTRTRDELARRARASLTDGG